MRYYYMAFIPTEQGEYIILSPDFQEVASQGTTLSECMEMSMDALQIVAKEYVRRKEPMPEPCDLQKAKVRIREELERLGGALGKDSIFQLVPAPDANMAPVRISATFPRMTLDIIDTKAKAHGMTRSGFLAAAAQAYF